MFEQSKPGCRLNCLVLAIAGTVAALAPVIVLVAEVLA